MKIVKIERPPYLKEFFLLPFIAISNNPERIGNRVYFGWLWWLYKIN